jgi:hypothetical protein
MFALAYMGRKRCFSNAFTPCTMRTEHAGPTAYLPADDPTLDFCPNWFSKMPRFSNRPFLGTTLSLLSSRAKPSGSVVRHSSALLLPANNLPFVIPGFQEWSAEPQIPPRHAGTGRLRSPGFGVEIGGGCGPVGAGHSNGAPQIRSASLGMTTMRGWFQGKSGC